MMWLLKHWRAVAVAAVLGIGLLSIKLYANKQYTAGYNAAAAKISTELAKAAERQAKQTRAQEEAANNELRAAQIKLEKEKQNAKKSIDSMRAELNRVQERVTHERSRTNLPKTTATTSSSDGEAATKGWQLFGECSSKYANLAEVADEQNADLHEWQAYGKAVSKQAPQ